MGCWLGCGNHGKNRNCFDINKIWSRELIQYQSGQFSMASIQSNAVMEEHCQVEVGTDKALFVGIYDGHGGRDDVSKHLAHNFFRKLWRYMKVKDQEMSLVNILKQVADDMERDIKRCARENTELDKIGSSCLVALIWGERLYILNIGDSRLLLGSELGNTEIIKAKQLSTDHNCKNELIRIKVQKQHPDSKILNKDSCKITRVIGDAHLKRECNSSAEPEIISRDIEKCDRCIIIASHGFWKLMSNEQTALIVERNRQQGIAKKLLREALKEAAKRKEIDYEQLMKKAEGPEGKHIYHEDITVIVVFLNKKNWWRKDIQNMSYRGFRNTTVKSVFAYDY
ncbi:putative protein-serine/threonine phosphatase [Medicago truncatula]|uniref:protein-serine/threonine phosphatase n=2 Tax=Medicago truncatula TaxID=3880 RepID=A0A396IGG0_MEDTR|nr:putative protein-serine/threonine phosphatase [Medicago truncatula]